jgi:glycine cleavage system T protein
MSTQLEELERASGAVFTPCAERPLPARFTTLHSEWSAVRQRCGLLDARFRGLLRMTGNDRVTFLQGMVSNDVARLKVGEGTYAALLTQQGRVVSDLRVSVLADELWLDVPAARTANVRDSLERYIIADDVEWVADDSCAPLVAVEGPQADRVLIAVTGEAVTGLPMFAHRELTFDGTHIRAVATTHTGETGYLLFGRPAAGPSLWEYCRAAGAEPVGMEALDVLRIEAGIPWYGRDMDESLLISEVGLEAAISYEKGCYLGQEVVERVAARGQVHRKLVGLVCDGQQVPPPGAKLLHDGKEAGWITSTVWSPARAAVIALGYARRECWEVGTEVQVALVEGTVTARVAPLPFYARQSNQQ